MTASAVERIAVIRALVRQHETGPERARLAYGLFIAWRENQARCARANALYRYEVLSCNAILRTKS